jgi:hypothetical protein
MSSKFKFIAKKNLKRVPIETDTLVIKFPIENFNGLERLVNLKFIMIENNTISSLKEFPLLSQLIRLDLINNRISSFKDIPSFSKLKTLNLNNNQITSFDDFPHLPRLTTLNVENNPIISFKGISMFTFKKTSFHWYFDEYSRDIVKKVISRDLEEHKDVIIKNTNEDDVLAAKLFLKFISRYNLHAAIFLIENNIKIVENNLLLIQNKDIIEKVCLKCQNEISKELLDYMHRSSKRIIKNGDIIFI